MIALDTNVLVRYLVSDDKTQSERAARLIDDAARAGTPLFVSHIVLYEVAWVLERAYKLSKPEIIHTMHNLLLARQLQVQDDAIVHRALDGFRRGDAGFADFLILETGRVHGCTALATFDTAVLRETGTVAP